MNIPKKYPINITLISPIWWLLELWESDPSQTSMLLGESATEAFLLEPSTAHFLQKPTSGQWETKGPFKFLGIVESALMQFELWKRGRNESILEIQF